MKEVLVEVRKEDKNGNPVPGDSGLIYSRAVPVNKIPVLDEDRYVERILANQNETIRINEDEEKYVMFFDSKNEFLNKLIALMNTSPTVKSIIKNKRRLTLGKGFIAHQGLVKTVLSVWRSLLQKIGIDDKKVRDLQEMLSRVNLKNESLEEVVGDGVFDFYGLGNCAFEMVRGVEDGKKFLNIYHIPIKQWKPREEDDQIVKYIGVLDNWDSISLDESEIKKLSMYPKWEKDEDGVERCAITLKDYSPGLVYWGLPDWASGVVFAEIEYRIGRYNVAKFVNGYVPSAIIQLFGNVSEKEAKEMVDEIVSTFTDTGNNSKMYIQVLRDEKMKANVEILEDKNDGSYMDLAKIAAQGIVTASRWMMSLAGFATAGKLGTNEQMRQEFEIVDSTVIEPTQNKVLSKVVNVFMKEYADWVGEFKDVNLTIAKLSPISFKGDLEIGNYITVNEGREILGFEPLEGEEGMRMVGSGRSTQQQEDDMEGLMEDVEDNLE